MRVIGNRGNTDRKVQATASGVLPNGKPVVVNADGTVSSISIASDAVTSPVAYNSSTTNHMYSALDTSTGKIMILYGDNEYYLVMATISGSSVSFGTPTVLSGNRLGDISYDVASGHFLLVYQGASNYGRAQVASLSGTNITVSTELVWASNVTSSCVLSYDPVRERHMCSYMNEGNNRLEARVFRINGTTPVAGGSTTLRSGPNTLNAICYDPDSARHVTTYMDYVSDNYAQKGKYNILRVGAGSSYMAVITDGTGVFADEAVKNGGRDGTAIVYDTTNNKYAFAYVANNGTLKMLVGTINSVFDAISFGSTTTIAGNSGGQGFDFSRGMTFDPTSGKIIITYNSAGTSGRITTANISGTSIVDKVTTTFESALTHTFTTTYNPNTKSALVFYSDGGNSYSATYALFTPSATNLTSENYIGIASNGYATGQAATINAKGAIAELNPVTKFAVTVANAGSGNRYYIDGTLQATVSLSEGKTYRFDQSDTSNNGHPIRLSTTSNGTHSGGVEYTTGVTTVGTPGSYGAYTQITVAIEAPTLYYYCSVHSLMGGQANTPDDARLTAGQSYFVQNNGDLGTTAANPSVFAGTAVSATKLIVKG